VEISASLVSLEQLGLLDPLDLWVNKDSRDCLAQMVTLVVLVQKEVWDKWVHRVILEQQEVLGKQATLDKQVLPDSVVRQVQLVTLEQLEEQEQ